VIGTGIPFVGAVITRLSRDARAVMGATSGVRRLGAAGSISPM